MKKILIVLGLTIAVFEPCLAQIQGGSKSVVSGVEILYLMLGGVAVVGVLAAIWLLVVLLYKKVKRMK